eukprot:scaffold15170_cov69-Phaeocystis_antarctica.AAC.2
MTKLIAEAATTPSPARVAKTACHPCACCSRGRSRSERSCAQKPRAEMRDESTAAPSLPKSIAKTAKGSEVGSAMAAAAPATSTVLVLAARCNLGSGGADAVSQLRGAKIFPLMVVAAAAEGGAPSSSDQSAAAGCGGT